MISLDNKISDPKSDSVARMKKYAATVEELHILVFGGRGDAWNEKNLFVYSVSTSSKITTFLTAKKIGARIVKKNQINVITTQDPFFTGLVGLLTKKKNTGLNVELHGDFYGSRFWHDKSPLWPFRLMLGKFVLRRADGIRVVSERQRKSLVEKLKIPAKKIVKIPVFVPTDIKITETAADLHSKFHAPWIIMCVGALRQEKNFIAAVKAMPKIIGECKGANLIVLGSGPEENWLRGCVGQYELENFVHFLGEMSHDKTMAHLCQADVLLIPSLTESWSRVAVEAAALGVSIVMTDVGLAGEIIKNGVSGEIISESSSEKIAEGVVRMLKDSVLANRYRAAAKEALDKLPSEEESLNLIKESWGNAAAQTQNSKLKAQS
jgi:glycosyltransferase involved in cell wall biosynthesis